MKEFIKNGTIKRKCNNCNKERVVWVGTLDGLPTQLCPECLQEVEDGKKI